jgi:hypothetical protein
MTQTPAGWYPSDGQERYWDGSAWTEQVRPVQGAGAPSGAQPPAQQPSYGQPSYGQPGPPPKKSHTLRNVLLILIALAVLFVGGCFAVVGLVANEASDSIEKDANKPGGTDNPLEITEGKAFEVDQFDYAAGWKVTGGAFGLDITNLKVTNNRDDKDSAIVEIKFWKGSEVLASADCTTSPIAPGTTARVTCISGDKLPKSYEKITINDTF